MKKLKKVKDGTRYDVTDYEHSNWDEFIWEEIEDDLYIYGTCVHLGEDCYKVERKDYEGEEFWIFPVSEVQVEDEEVIGYKWKQGLEEMYGGSANLIIGVSTRDKWEWDVSKKCQLINPSEGVSSLKSAGVLDLWFDAVYKEKVKYKEGDIVYIVHDFSPEKEKHMGDGNKGNVGVFVEYSEEDNANEYPYIVDGLRQDGIYVHEIRLATPSEAKTLSLKMKIGDYEVTFNKTSVTINDKEYSKADLRAVERVLQLPHFHDLKFGCVGQISITSEIIEKIFEKM